MSRRVVITAMAAITPIGDSRETMKDSLLEGRSGVKALKDDGLLSRYIRIRRFRHRRLRDRFRHSAPFSQNHGAGGPVRLQGGREVIDQAGSRPNLLGSGRVGVAFGSTHGSPTVQREHLQAFFHAVNRQFALHRRGRLSQIDGAHHRRQHHQHVGITGRVHFLHHRLHHQQPVHRFRL